MYFSELEKFHIQWIKNRPKVSILLYIFRRPMKKRRSWKLAAVCLNVHVPPNFLCWKPDVQGKGTRRWGLWEVIRSWGWNTHKHKSLWHFVISSPKRNKMFLERRGNGHNVSSMNDYWILNSTLDAKRQ